MGRKTGQPNELLTGTAFHATGLLILLQGVPVDIMRISWDTSASNDTLHVLDEGWKACRLETLNVTTRWCALATYVMQNHVRVRVPGRGLLWCQDGRHQEESRRKRGYSLILQAIVDVQDR